MVLFGWHGRHWICILDSSPLYCIVLYVDGGGRLLTGGMKSHPKQETGDGSKLFLGIQIQTQRNRASSRTDKKIIQEREMIDQWNLHVTLAEMKQHSSRTSLHHLATETKVAIAPCRPPKPLFLRRRRRSCNGIRTSSPTRPVPILSRWSTRRKP
jgi:hypothetical protein